VTGADMVSTALALYSVMDGLHITVSIIAVHILGPRIIGTWGRSELWPPLFGGLRDLGYISLKGLLPSSKILADAVLTLRVSSFLGKTMA
jgi:hypothetical protein